MFNGDRQVPVVTTAMLPMLPQGRREPPASFGRNTGAEEAVGRPLAGARII
jgi:hypothetical protein